MSDSLSLPLNVYGEKIRSRLLLGTARYPSPATMHKAIEESGSAIVTVGLRRQSPEELGGAGIWEQLRGLNCRLLPNTAGCRTAREAIAMAKMAREIFATSWLKLEVVGDDYTLQPDPFALVEAAEELVKDGFQIFPYCTEDLVLCEKLLDVGCELLMPWASPIGTGRGISNPYGLETLRKRLPDTTLIVDAGIGTPSQAAAVMEMGYDAVLLNTAVAEAGEPVQMAKAFAAAIDAGRTAYTAGLMQQRQTAQPSTTTTGMPFWHQESSRNGKA